MKCEEAVNHRFFFNIIMCTMCTFFKMIVFKIKWRRYRFSTWAYSCIIKMNPNRTVKWKESLYGYHNLYNVVKYVLPRCLYNYCRVPQQNQEKRKVWRCAIIYGHSRIGTGGIIALDNLWNDALMTEDDTSKALTVVFLNVRNMKELLNVYKITSVIVHRDKNHKQEAVYKVLTTSAMSGELR